MAIIELTATDAAAWVGAITGSFAIFWEIFVWLRTGPRIKVTVAGDMQFAGPYIYDSGHKLKFVVEAKNVGDSKTTITHMFARYYESWWQQYVRRKANRQFIVANPLPGQIPHLLDAGERWMGCSDQTPEMEKFSREGRLYFGIYHSTSDKPCVARVVLRKTDVGQIAE